MKFNALILFFALGFFANVLGAETVLNIHQPVRNLQVTDEQMRQAIVNAANAQQWQVTSEAPGLLSAVYRKSDYMAKITINYAPTYYAIEYADSRRMRYDGRTIHPTYNRLIKALQAEIVRNLRSGNFATETGRAEAQKTESAPAGQEEDIRSKLLKLKRLHEEGLITTEEYDAKRKSLIESY